MSTDVLGAGRFSLTLEPSFPPWEACHFRGHSSPRGQHDADQSPQGRPEAAVLKKACSQGRPWLAPRNQAFWRVPATPGTCKSGTRWPNGATGLLLKPAFLPAAGAWARRQARPRGQPTAAPGLGISKEPPCRTILDTNTTQGYRNSSQALSWLPPRGTSLAFPGSALNAINH